MPGTAPALFIGHGSPMYAITENPYTAAWAALAKRFPKPKAVLCVSAHWETEGIRVTTSAQPRTIHDFYNFPRELYQLTYPAPGAPELAERIADVLSARAESEWGLDHGAWSVLRVLFPNADVPVIQLSLDKRESPAGHYAIGKRLAGLRDEGVLVLGSGNIVHTLRLHRGAVAPYDWAIKFDGRVKQKIAENDHGALTDYDSLSEEAALAVPTPEHYLPLLYMLAVCRAGEKPEFLTEDVTGAISMRSVAVGV